MRRQRWSSRRRLRGRLRARMLATGALAPRPGFEPGLEDSKSSVLPLDDLGTGAVARESAGGR